MAHPAPDLSFVTTPELLEELTRRCETLVVLALPKNATVQKVSLAGDGYRVRGMIDQFHADLLSGRVDLMVAQQMRLDEARAAEEAAEEAESDDEEDHG